MGFRVKRKPDDGHPAFFIKLKMCLYIAHCMLNYIVPRTSDIVH